MKRRCTMRSDLRQRQTRCAFTVLEMIMALVIVVALAGLSWPRLSSVLQRESVMGNAENVRQVLDHARVQAVEDGVTYQFRFEPNGRKYVLLPNELLVDDSGNSAMSGSQTQSGNSVRPAIVHELSEDCSFYVPPVLVTGEATITERLSDAWLRMVSDGTAYRDVAWSAPILYSPDGTATDGAVTVIDENRRYLTLSVRGLTGSVITSRIAQMSELYGGSSN